MLATQPPRRISHRGRLVTEFDLDAALARRPALILMDELAHSNAPGSRHPKRWPDVDELLEAGIDVFTTVNVQHLESLNDVVSGITGVQVRETVPDPFFDAADDVVLVDLPPDDLRQRLNEGKVYIGGQAERAIENFFRKGNLIALRELALRRTADRVDEQMRVCLYRQGHDRVRHSRHARRLSVGANSGSGALARAAARLAARLGSVWHAVYVETPSLHRLPEGRRRAILAALRLAQELGADALLLISPYYNKANAEGMYRHFAETADAVDIPCILYNVPGRTGCSIPVSVVERLARHPNIAGIKEASGDMSYAMKIARCVGPDFALYSGNDDITVPILSIGGSGVISVYANVMPAMCRQIVADWLDGNHARALENHLRYLQLMNDLFLEVNPIPVKAAMNMMGLDVGPMRLPLCEMGEANAATLRQTLEEAGLL